MLRAERATFVEPTGTAIGNSVRSRKGDFLITLDPSWTRGVPVRVAVEAKSGRVGLAKLCSRPGRDAAATVAHAIAVAVVSRRQRAVRLCAVLTLHGEHIICELDPDDPDDTAFTAAVRLGRALGAVRRAGPCRDVVDAAAVRRDLDGIRAQLNAIVGMKSKLTSISTATGDVRNGLDALQVRGCSIGSFPSRATLPMPAVAQRLRGCRWMSCAAR